MRLIRIDAKSPTLRKSRTLNAVKLLEGSGREETSDSGSRHAPPFLFPSFLEPCQGNHSLSLVCPSTAFCHSLFVSYLCSLFPHSEGSWSVMSNGSQQEPGSPKRAHSGKSSPTLSCSPANMSPKLGGGVPPPSSSSSSPSGSCSFFIYTPLRSYHILAQHNAAMLDWVAYVHIARDRD